MIETCIPPCSAMAFRPDSAAAFDMPYTPRGLRSSFSLNGPAPSVLVPLTRMVLTKMNVAERPPQAQRASCSVPSVLTRR